MANFIFDEFGRVYICTRDGDPYAGPFDTEEDAEDWLASLDDGDDDA